MKLIAAKCPSCSADIQVPDDKDFAFCTFCGANVKVRESVIMKNHVDVDNLIELGNVELQAKDYDEAMNYFTRVLDADGKSYKAWLGKGNATLRKANTDLKRYEEALIYFENGMNYCPENKKEELTEKIITEYSGKKYYIGHTEFLDKLIKIKPEKKLLMYQLNLLADHEEDIKKSGMNLSADKKAIKTDTISILKENYPKDYETYLKRLELQEKREELQKTAKDSQTISNEERELAQKKKDLFSGKAILGGFISAAFLNTIVTFCIIFSLEQVAPDSGLMLFLSIFVVLFIFSNLAMYINKRKEISKLQKHLEKNKKVKTT